MKEEEKLTAIINNVIILQYKNFEVVTRERNQPVFLSYTTVNQGSAMARSSLKCQRVFWSGTGPIGLKPSGIHQPGPIRLEPSNIDNGKLRCMISICIFLFNAQQYSVSPQTKHSTISRLLRNLRELKFIFIF